MPDILIELDVPMPPPKNGHGGPRTELARAIAKLAEESTPIGASFFTQDPLSKVSSAICRLGRGWATTRKVNNLDAEGIRVWKLAPAPGKSATVSIAPRENVEPLKRKGQAE